MPYANFQLSESSLNSIDERRMDAAGDSAYAAAVSFVEAISGIKSGSTSWAVIKLYYSSFYSVRALLLMNGVVPFNGGEEMLLDIPENKFLKGGKSSHHWNWASINKTALKSAWFSSQDSQDAYQKLRDHRENVNYTHGFVDPELHSSLVSSEADMSKRFRAYRDDDSFLYTYLQEHLALAYPTRMLLEVDKQAKSKNLTMSAARSAHLLSMWKFKDRCLLT